MKNHTRKIRTQKKSHTIPPAGRSSNSNSFCQSCFLCRCRQLGHLSNF